MSFEFGDSFEDGVELTMAFVLLEELHERHGVERRSTKERRRKDKPGQLSQH